jgi:hypothetical protein
VPTVGKPTGPTVKDERKNPPEYLCFYFLQKRRLNVNTSFERQNNEKLRLWSSFEFYIDGGLLLIPVRHSRFLLINPLNAELNPICHLLALLGAHHIFHVSRRRINARFSSRSNSAGFNLVSHLICPGICLISVKCDSCFTRISDVIRIM